MAEHVARMVKTRNAYRILVRMLERDNFNEFGRNIV
jgi:hypothetical protein